MRIISNIISGIFHPILMPLFTYGLLVFIKPSEFSYLPFEVSRDLYLRIVLNGVIFPVLGLLLLRGLGFIKSFKLETQEERHGPYIVLIFFYVWLFFSFKLENEHSSFLVMALLAGMLCSIFAFIINLIITKVSAHTIGAGYMVALAIVTSPLAERPVIGILAAVILLAGLVGTSRIFLGAHSSKQVFLGYLAGIFSIMVALRFTF